VYCVPKGELVGYSVMWNMRVGLVELLSMLRGRCCEFVNTQCVVNVCCVYS